MGGVLALQVEAVNLDLAQRAVDEGLAVGPAHCDFLALPARLMAVVIVAYSVMNFVIQSIIQPKFVADAVNDACRIHPWSPGAGDARPRGSHPRSVEEVDRCPAEELR